MTDVRDPASRLVDLVDELAPKLRRKFLEAVFVVKSRLTLEVLIGYLEAGRIEEAELVVERAISAFAAEVAKGVVASGEATAEVISRAVDVSFHFDATNLRVVQAAREAKADLVREVVAEQRQVIRNAIFEGITTGVNPRQQARLIRDSIGLTQRQQAAVYNYKRLLQSGSTEALDRQLRDRRFDRTVQSAIDSGEVLNKTQVDRMVERYQERYLQYRSEVIARTEALRAVHVGNEATFEQAFESGDLDRDQVVREWNTAKDERVRASHRFMHGQKRAVGEPFISGDGNKLAFPGDPTAPAADVVSCRCAVGTRIVLTPDETQGVTVQVITYQPAVDLAG